MAHLNASKGHQFFALRVDQELQRILLRSLSDSMKHIDVGFSDRYRPELEAIVASAYYLFAYVFDKPTPGMAVFQLALKKNRPLEFIEGVARREQKGVDDEERDLRSSLLLRYLPILVILAQYIHKRLDKLAVLGNWRQAPQNSWKYRLHRTLRIFEVCFRVAGVANTLLFLWFGVYPTLFQRISGVQMVNNFCDAKGYPLENNMGIDPNEPILQVTPAEGYSPAQVYLKTRQIGWSVLTQLAGTFLWVFDWPSIRLQSWRLVRRVGRVSYRGIVKVSRSVRNKWLSLMHKVSFTSTESPVTSMVVAGDSIIQREGRSRIHSIGARTNEHVVGDSGAYDCTCCGASPAEVPHISNCSHIYCYSCIYYITRGFTATNNQHMSIIRDVVDGEAEERRRDRALEEPFPNSLGIGPSDVREAYADRSVTSDDEYLNDSASAGDFIGVSNRRALAEGASPNEETDDLPQYLCPICDTIVISGERFSLQ